MHKNVKLFVGIMFNETINILEILKTIESKLNKSIDTKSTIYNFNHSTYYSNEMGHSLKRMFITFKELIPPEEGYKIKHLTINIEKKFSRNNKRNINLDPGIMSMHNLILYSTKNYAHRIACNNKIYAELTFLFVKKQVKVLEWTYPDFHKQAIQNYFLEARKIYKQQIVKDS